MNCRILLLAVTVVVWLSRIVLAASPGAAESSPPRLGVADSMATVFCSPTEASAKEAAGSIAWQKPLRVGLAQNEFEGAQIVIEAPADRAVHKVCVRLSPLARDDSPQEIWPDRDVSLWQVGQVEVYNLWPPHQSLGWYPDPLLPLNGPLDVPAGERCAVLACFHATAELAAGTYRGEAVVSAEALPELRLPVEVTVWDFALPVEQHFTLAIPIWGGHMEKMYPGSQTPERRRAYLDMLYDHRVAPIALSQDDIPHAIQRGMRDFCLTCFAKDGVEPEKAKQVGEQMALWQKNGWDKTARTYVLLGDEAPRDCYPYLREQGRLVREASPAVARRFTVSPEMIQDIAWVDRQMHGLAEALILGVSPDATDRLSRDVRATGLGLWWYYVALHYYVPMNNDGQARLVFWRHWKYQVPGQLHWGMTYWGDSNIAGRDGKRWPEIAWHTKGCRGGDGYLVYPAPGGAAFWPSVRLEQLRDGVEDYEYLHALRERTERLQSKGAPSSADRIAANRGLLDIDASLVKTYAEYDNQPEAYRRYRERIAEAIVATEGLIGKGR